MGLGNRIRHYRNKAGVTLQQLSDLSGVEVGTISALEQRDSSRSQHFPAIAKALGLTMEELADESTEWELELIAYSTPDRTEIYIQKAASHYPELYSGGPDHERADHAPRGRLQPTLQPILAWQHEDDLPPGEFVMVPRLELKLSAGNGNDQVEIQFNEAQPQAFRADWVRNQGLKPKKLAAMTADGRSMEPTIHDGDSLLVDTGQIEVKDGKVYALWYEGGERVKRLFRMPGGGLRIRSDNATENPEILLGPEYMGHVRIIGRVVHRSGPGGL